MLKGGRRAESAFSSGGRAWVSAPRIARFVCCTATARSRLSRGYFRLSRGGRVSAGGVWTARACSAAHTDPASARSVMPPLPARPAAITTIRDTVSCTWIFYSECRLCVHCDFFCHFLKLWSCRGSPWCVNATEYCGNRVNRMRIRFSFVA